MLDLILGWAVIFFPTALAVVFIFVPARSENKSAHMKWRFCLVVFGVLFSLLAWLQQSRALKAATNDRESAIKESSERVATDTADRVTKAMTAQYEGTISGLNRQIGGLQTELSAIHKASKETTNALVRLNTTTETSVKGIPRPRRIPTDKRAALIVDLSAHKGVVTINCVGGDGESKQFANDWYDLLFQAGWTLQSGVNVTYTPDTIVGARITVRGEPIAPGEGFTIPGEHPASALGRSLYATTTSVTGQRRPDLAQNATVLDIGVLPRPN